MDLIQDSFIPPDSARPWHLAREYAEQYQDLSVVDAYDLRPLYPSETFSVLEGLYDPQCRRVLDVGCGTGEIARRIAPLVDRVDAVDLSGAMIEKGRRLPGGDAGNLSWIEGEIERVNLAGLYGLITAASSLHWMEWSVVMPAFSRILSSEGKLAIVFEHLSGPPQPYAERIGRLILQSLTERGIAHRGPFDLVEELRSRGLFRVEGERLTTPVTQEQSVGDFVGSIHARTNFSRDLMGSEAAEAFDVEAMKILNEGFPTGIIEMTVQMKVVWGRPS